MYDLPSSKGTLTKTLTMQVQRSDSAILIANQSDQTTKTMYHHSPHWRVVVLDYVHPKQH